MKIRQQSCPSLVSLIIFSTFLVANVCSFEMNCTISSFSNTSFEVTCNSDKKFKFCTLEKKFTEGSEKQSKYCKFHFNQPIKYPGVTKAPPTMLELYYQECSLDPDSSRIQIVDKNIQKQCHLRISHIENLGKLHTLFNVSI